MLNRKASECAQRRGEEARRTAPRDFLDHGAQKRNWERAPDKTSPSFHCAQREFGGRGHDQQRNQSGDDGAKPLHSSSMAFCSTLISWASRGSLRRSSLRSSGRSSWRSSLIPPPRLVRTHGAIGQKRSFRNRVRHEDDGDPAGSPQFAELGVQAKARDFIQRGERLVEQEQTRLVD